MLTNPGKMKIAAIVRIGGRFHTAFPIELYNVSWVLQKLRTVLLSIECVFIVYYFRF